MAYWLCVNNVITILNNVIILFALVRFGYTEIEKDKRKIREKERRRFFTMFSRHFVLVLFIFLTLTGCGKPERKISDASPDPVINVVHDEDPGTASEIDSEDEPSRDPERFDPADRESLQAAFEDNYCNGDATFYGKVNEDVTGRWRMLVFYSGTNIAEHIPEYYEAYWQDPSEVHFLVNLYLRTTTVVNRLSDDLLSVAVHEYEDKEELYAGSLAGGMLYGQYLVHLDTGEIEELENDS